MSPPLKDEDIETPTQTLCRHIHQTSFRSDPNGQRLVKVGLVGCGRIGVLHLEALTKAPGVLPIICSNPTISKAKKAAEDFNVKEYTSDAMDVINHPEVQAVWICSPSQFHAEQIIACAKNGKHVFCEKPIATDIQETILAIDACQAANVKLMIGLQRRFDKNFARVKKAVSEKEVGDPFMIKLTSRDPAPPPVKYVQGGGGIFMDMMVHDLDMSRFLAGACPVDIMATGGTNIDPAIIDLPGSEQYDTATCVVRFANGMTATIDVCRQSSYGYDQRAEVLGTKGMIQTGNEYPNTAHICTCNYTGNADLPYDFFLERYKKAYIDETIEFCKSLTEGTPSPVSGKDGLCSLVMALAADRSAAENRWVKFLLAAPFPSGKALRHQTRPRAGTLWERSEKKSNQGQNSKVLHAGSYAPAFRNQWVAGVARGAGRGIQTRIIYAKRQGFRLVSRATGMPEGMRVGDLRTEDRYFEASVEDCVPRAWVQRCPLRLALRLVVHSLLT